MIPNKKRNTTAMFSFLSHLLSYQITQSPIHGTLSGQNEVYLYTPNNHFFGQDSIKFTASDQPSANDQ